MRTTAVICEFDPLHRGHEYLISEARNSGAECIVCIMSGAFCQRGEPSAFDRHTRARAALSAGADLVLELPFPFSCASAEFFAFGAMSIIAALGGIDTLAFGCESGDSELLHQAALFMCSAEFAAEYEKAASEHPSMGAAALMELSYTNLRGDSTIFSGANNILAIEYIKAAHRLSMPISLLGIKRRGSGHSDMYEHDPFASASLIREQLRGGARDISMYLPDSTAGIFMREIEQGWKIPSLCRAERAILGHFRLSSDAADAAELSGGLGNRIADAACTAETFEGLMSLARTKKYTDARIRRAIVFSMCRVRETDLHTPPSYITLLGANRKGMQFLSECKKTRTLPLVSTPAMLGTLPPQALRAYELARAAEGLRALCTERVRAVEESLRTPPVIVKN